jgi:murein DD-endopeptidase MepM/ murein hydrolase activator NlpD
MKKHNLAEFFKSKSFYALLCVGALAIMAIAMVGLNQSSEKDKNNNLVDLNESIVSDVADGEDNSNQEIGNQSDTNNASPEVTANNKAGSNQTEVAQGDTNQPVTDGSLLEFDIYEDPNGEASIDGTDAGVKEAAADTKASDAVESKTEEAKAVMKPETLHFKVDDGLLWPVTGNVLMNYSMDRVIYFQTLAQFKCNPAIIIDAKVGTEVLSAAKGIVTSIVDDAETGKTVTASIGSGYSVVYGQLKDVKVEVGDTIDEGDVIATIAEPTKYYSLEGSNLYFQVFNEKETMNPMLFLRN